jgi:hypothetical protein
LEFIITKNIEGSGYYPSKQVGVIINNKHCVKSFEKIWMSLGKKKWKGGSLRKKLQYSSETIEWWFIEIKYFATLTIGNEERKWIVEL